MAWSSPRVGGYLDRIASTYGTRFLHTDPLVEVRRFTAPADRETAAFLAAGFAFGRVGGILGTLRQLWDRLDGSPAAVVDRWSSRDRRRLAGFRYRWVGEGDLETLLRALGRVRARHGSLHGLFSRGHDPGDPDLRRPLAALVRGIGAEVRIHRRRVDLDDLPRGVRTFLADPDRGGACKRLNLFLRWMVRPDDGVDLGLWPGVGTHRLVVPLDTHVARISRNLGFTRRRTVDWKMASEVTESLRRFDPHDPVRYDFPLARLGILEACPRRVERTICRGCELLPVCRRGRGLRV